jgi:hypothetical protein
MPKYMGFIVHSEDYRNKEIPQGLMDAMGTFVGDSMNNVTLFDTDGLLPTSQAVRVRLSKGKVTAKDGPFTETKEVVGGYALFNAKDKKDAVDFATKFMELHRIHWPEFEGSCEVRQLEDFDNPPQKKA